MAGIIKECLVLVVSLFFFWFDYLGFYIWLLWLLGMMSIVAMVWYMMQLDKKNEDNLKYQDSL